MSDSESSVLSKDNTDNDVLSLCLSSKEENSAVALSEQVSAPVVVR